MIKLLLIKEIQQARRGRHTLFTINRKVITACAIMREAFFEYLNEKLSLARKVKI